MSFCNSLMKTLFLGLVLCGLTALPAGAQGSGEGSGAEPSIQSGTSVADACTGWHAGTGFGPCADPNG